MAAIRCLPTLSLVVLVMAGCSESDSGPDGNPQPAVTEVSGSVAANRSWSGTVRLTADADIAAGVQVTIAAGTVFEGAQDAVLRVHGSLSIDGTAQHPVTMQPLGGANSWGGLVVESGGAAAIHHATGSKVATLLLCKAGALQCFIDSAVFSDLGQAIDASSQVNVVNSDFLRMTTAGVVVTASGDLTLIDSVLWGAPADLVVVSGGKLTVDHSDLGSTELEANEHGELFISSSTGLSVTYSNIISGVYGVSIGSTNQAVLQYNNFLQNDQDIGDLGTNTAVDMRYNYWDSGAPTLSAAFDVSAAAAFQIATAGPRR